jgi:hypothetical protein
VRLILAKLLFLDVFLQIHGTDFGTVDIAFVVHRDAFRGARSAFRFRVWDEGRYPAVFGAPDPDAPFAARIISVAWILAWLVRVVCGFRVSHVHGVVLVYENSAGPAELLPLGEEFAVLIEDLNAIVGAIGDE